uniref:WD repeat-containing protein 43 n=1 Tax=Ciona intestinalis TaxID=7719 RepID=F6WEC1_CIOIN|nr:WD repeat-containing protein 43 [Ciona intestinalis]|eukprot:XP_002128623.1 WD repeat-containing protein 43 [Ciona intestinalis]
MAAVGRCKAAFSGEDKLALCSLDGVLHVWDVKSGVERHQFTPASHLTATFTCLSWKIAHHRNNDKLTTPKKKKARKSENISPHFEYIALGTEVGDALLYDNIAGDLVCKFTGGHNGRINDICWKSDDNTFFTCSNDHHIIEWDASHSKHKCKWKADKWEVHSIKVGPHCKTLLSAGKTIKLWSLKTKEVIRRFNGHLSPVISMLFVELPAKISSHDSTALEAVDETYFLSAASDGHALNAWQIRSTKPKKNAITTFSLPSDALMFDVLSPSSRDDPIYVLVTTLDGDVLVFSHTLNGPMKKPLTPIYNIRVVTPTAEQLSVISATFDKKNEDPVIVLAYGTTAGIAFETLKIKEHSGSEICLIREDPAQVHVLIEKDKLKLKEPLKNKENVTTIVPGVPGHNRLAVEKSGTKRKKNPSIGEAQLTLEERLTAMSVDTASPNGDYKAPPNADSLAILLSQGLQSNDRDVLNQVLQHSNDNLIRNTVRQVPINYVVSLLKELTERLKGTPEKCLIFMKWTRTTLSQHASYLMTLPEVVPLLTGLYQLISVRTQTHERLTKLEGKLDLIMTQIVSRKTTEKISEQPALFVVEEDSSDDHDEDINMMSPESFDEWDEGSEDEHETNEETIEMQG